MSDKEENCGTCIHHMPTVSGRPVRFKSGPRKGRLSYWVCACEKKGEETPCLDCDGKDCKFYKSRFENYDNVETWRRHAGARTYHTKGAVKAMLW